MNNQDYIDQAIETITKMLTKKKDVWTDQDALENFDDKEVFSVDALQFALCMCKLKMTRLQNRWKKHGCDQMMVLDPDVKDSLIDLASYAILGLAVLERDHDMFTSDNVKYHVSIKNSSP